MFFLCAHPNGSPPDETNSCLEPTHLRPKHETHAADGFARERLADRIVSVAVKHIAFDEIVWHEPTGSRADCDRSAEVSAAVPGRKFLVDGDAGFYTQTVRLPPGFEAPPHRHDHAELFMVLEGGCEFNGLPMQPYDTTVVESNESYGFTAGAHGCTFHITRMAIATFTEVDPS